MAILFDDASSEYIEVDSTPAVAAPFTMACWMNTNDVSVSQVLMAIEDKDVANQVWLLSCDGAVAGDKIRLFANAGAGGVEAVTSTGVTVNTWHHACGVVASATDRRVFIDGGSKGTNTTSRAPSGADRLSIGRLGTSIPEQYMSGSIAEAAIWNIALSDAEVALLALGAHPLLVRPEAIIFYLPMVALGGAGSQNDWITLRTMTETNTPATSAHVPKIFYPDWLSTGYGIPSISSALAGSLHLTGLMTAIPLAANYKIYASDVPKRTFSTRD